MRFYVKLPLCCEHKGHPIGGEATINQLVDKKIISKIYELVNGKGITRPDEIKGYLDDCVERDLFPIQANRPKKTNRRYYPTRQDLRNHIAKAICASKCCKDDQESLRIKLDDWKVSGSTANFFFRPKSV